jgi:hypothetical protein
MKNTEPVSYRVNGINFPFPDLLQGPEKREKTILDMLEKGESTRKMDGNSFRVIKKPDGIIYINITTAGGGWIIMHAYTDSAWEKENQE